jgi:uncharacterized protein (DUF2062 family)
MNTHAIIYHQMTVLLFLLPIATRVKTYLTSRTAFSYQGQYKRVNIKRYRNTQKA